LSAGSPSNDVYLLHPSLVNKVAAQRFTIADHMLMAQPAVERIVNELQVRHSRSTEHTIDTDD